MTPWLVGGHDALAVAPSSAGVFFLLFATAAALALKVGLAIRKALEARPLPDGRVGAVESSPSGQPGSPDGARPEEADDAANEDSRTGDSGVVSESDPDVEDDVAEPAPEREVVTAASRPGVVESVEPQAATEPGGGNELSATLAEALRSEPPGVGSANRAPLGAEAPRPAWSDSSPGPAPAHYR